MQNNPFKNVPINCFKRLQTDQIKNLLNVFLNLYQTISSISNVYGFVNKVFIYK